MSCIANSRENPWYRMKPPVPRRRTANDNTMWNNNASTNVAAPGAITKRPHRPVVFVLPRGRMDLHIQTIQPTKGNGKIVNMTCSLENKAGL